ncbi:MAG TPA: outer membrane protein assembly factor BamA [Planctomycetota bacterium]|nr:outer membrane protein assembly factor BamA [Planctomycetota bacterium]
MNERLQHGSPRSVRLALAAFCLACGAAAVAAEQPVVREVIIRGYAGDPATIKDMMQVREGARLDPDRLNNDLMALFNAGHLATYQIQAVPTGVRLIIDITEALRARAIQVRGVGSDWATTLRADLVTQPKSPVSPDVLKQPEDGRYRGDKERIRAYCQARGYRSVTITSATFPVPNTPQIDITFSVNLGPKYQVKWLTFRGNRSLRTRELRRQMETKLDGFWTSRRYCDAVFEKDIERLQDYYRYRGFPNAKVSYQRRFLGPQGNKVEITIVVDEGQLFAVGVVEMKGVTKWGTDTLLTAIPLKAGDTFSDDKLIEARQIIERLYHENGYPDVQVAPSRQVSAAGDAFDVTFTIDEGEEVRINTVRTRGHPRTRRDVILREMELEPGMLYDVRRLERSDRAIQRLQYFDSVVIRLVPADPPAPGERDLLVDVTEGQTGLFRFGLGASSSLGIVGTIELAQRNFDWRDAPKSWSDLWSGNAYVGAGQQFRVTLMPGSLYSSYAIAYDNPYWRGRNESFGWSVYHRTRDQGVWDEVRTGVRVYRGIRKYKGDPDTDVTFHARLEAVNVLLHDEDDDPTITTDDPPKDAVDAEGSHPVFGAGVTVRRDRKDRPTFPTRGYEWELGTELVVPHGITLGAGGTRFWTLGRHPKGYERVISLRGRVDYELGSFPIYERLYAGGANLRGFAYRGAGPTDNKEPIGGKYRALASAEYRYPIAPPNFYGVFFADAGTVTRDFSGFSSPRLALGFGIRLLIPALSHVPISVDFSAPVIKQGGDETEFLYFSLSLGR